MMMNISREKGRSLAEVTEDGVDLAIRDGENLVEDKVSLIIFVLSEKGLPI